MEKKPVKSNPTKKVTKVKEVGFEVVSRKIGEMLEIDVKLPKKDMDAYSLYIWEVVEENTSYVCLSSDTEVEFESGSTDLTDYSDTTIILTKEQFGKLVDIINARMFKTGKE
jgi:hypothetical protein